MSTEIFVSYAHEDERYVKDDSLLGHLRGVEKDGAHFWTDRGEIKPGDEWDKKIKDQIERTDIALLLVSQSYLLSEYSQNTEVNSFLRRARRDGMLIFPVILSACDWKEYDWLKSRQHLPEGDMNIAEHFDTPEGKRLSMFQTITDALRERVKAVEKAKQAAPSDIAIAAASKSVNMVNRMYPQVESFHSGGPEEERTYGVVFEGKGDRVVAQYYGRLKTLTADDLKKVGQLSERQMRSLSVYQGDLEQSLDRWEGLYLRRRGEPADVRRETEREMRQVIADMRESLNNVFDFLRTARLDIDDHYEHFLSLIRRESQKAQKESDG